MKTSIFLIILVTINGQTCEDTCTVNPFDTNNTVIAGATYLPQPNPKDRCDDTCTEHPYDTNSTTHLAITIVVEGGSSA